MATERSFKVGETVHLGVKVSLPGTRTPTNATVTLVSLKRGETTEIVADPEFEHPAEGEYTLSIPTVGRTPGTYDVVVRVDDGPTKVVILTDTFVLVAV